MSTARDSAREAAQARSRYCEHCGGVGMVTVFHPEYHGEPVVELQDHDRGVVRVPGRVMAHCTCDLGRWMREKTDPETCRRIPDFGDVLALQSLYLPYDPTEPEEFRQGGRSYAAMRAELGERFRVSRKGA